MATSMCTQWCPTTSPPFFPKRSKILTHIWPTHGLTSHETPRGTNPSSSSLHTTSRTEYITLSVLSMIRRRRRQITSPRFLAPESLSYTMRPSRTAKNHRYEQVRRQSTRPASATSSRTNQQNAEEVNSSSALLKTHESVNSSGPRCTTP